MDPWTLDAEETMWRSAAELGDTAHTERVEAEWLAADARGDLRGPRHVGWLCHERGDVAGAEAAWQRGKERGDPECMTRLFWLDREHAPKRVWAAIDRAWRALDEAGDAEAAERVGTMCRSRDDIAGALAAWRRADQRGSAEAAYRLGSYLSEERGHDDFYPRDAKKAEKAYQRADERGSDAGAFWMATILERRGDLAGAEAAYRRAIRRGTSGAPARGLSLLLEHRGDWDEAEFMLRLGIRRDERYTHDPNDLYELGRFLIRRGDLERAETAFRVAVERGYPSSQFLLNSFLENPEKLVVRRRR
ncbi:hypothetical protein ALI144C_20540 [Actinosynnema sp. ALI-1.44]|uniref:tetratricopeptide repeat protein n=1 Tax=Actinosynnema sp. ALI-1.44 TaxID=1933779 RepID=UPI00097BE0A2|nr:tetratricopeptide repeat protein [Actinosynnema sp. ALI-1.44]ONI81677.1 hypothetical protein ALI144C_20540 [Actinosynnema sp. ALI-1.44]